MLLTLCSLLFTACQYEVYDQSALRVQKVPTFPGANPAKFYGLDEEVKTEKPLVLVNSFNYDMEPSSSQEDAIERLTPLSQEYGYDIVDLRQAMPFSWEEADYSGAVMILSALAGEDISGDYTTYFTNRFKIDAYKYLDNMDYVDQLTFSRELFQISSDGIMTPIARQFLEPNGKELKVTGKKLSYYKLFKFSEHYFLNAEEGWKYHWVNTQRLIRKNDRYRIKIDFSGTRENKVPTHAKMYNYLTPEPKYFITIFFDDTGKITGKEVLVDGQSFVSMRYEFDSIGRVQKELIEVPGKNEQYVVLYEYYDQARILEYSESIRPGKSSSVADVKQQ